MPRSGNVWRSHIYAMKWHMGRSATYMPRSGNGFQFCTVEMKAREQEDSNLRYMKYVYFVSNKTLSAAQPYPLQSKPLVRFELTIFALQKQRFTN